MKKHVIFLALASIVMSAPFLAKADDEITRARRQFLFNLGFNDVPSEIRGRLERGQYQHELNRRQMGYNITSYEIINASRELALLIFSGTDIERKGEALALFTAKMLALKPLAPAVDYPSNIMSMPEGDVRDMALAQWLNGQRRRQMELHKDRILSDIVGLIYGGASEEAAANIRRIDRLLTTIIDRIYLDDLIGNGKYFGRALTALLAREDLLSGRESLMPVLSHELKYRYNLQIENFIGDTLAIAGKDGVNYVKVENGTMMLTRNLSAGSLNVSMAAFPANLIDRWRARFNGLIGSPLAIPLYVSPEDTADGISLSMRVRDRIAQGGILRMGFSHIVFFQVKEDPETRIKMARVIDNFPNTVVDYTGEHVRSGGTRFTYPEQVINQSSHSAVYIANPNPEKVQAWSKKSLRVNGYQAEFFPSIELELDGVTPIKNSRVRNWQTSISQGDFNELHAEPDAEVLSKHIWKRFTDGLEQTVYDGYTFHWPDPYDFYLVGSTYCSQLGDMVMRKYVGIPLEQHESEWHWGIRFLAHVGNVATEVANLPGLRSVSEKLLGLPGVKDAMKVAEVKIIAPNALILQPYMNGNAYMLASRTPEQRAQSSFYFGDYTEENPRLTAKVHELVPEDTFANKSFDIILEYGASMRDLEYGMVMRASYGIKTPGFDVSRIAKQASRMATGRLLGEWAKAGYPNAPAGYKGHACQEIVGL